MNTNLPPTPRLVLDMRRNDNGLFQWYEIGTDNAADVCPPADTPTKAWDNAVAVWRGAAWNLKQLSPTVCEIDNGGYGHA